MSISIALAFFCRSSGLLGRLDLLVSQRLYASRDNTRGGCIAIDDLGLGNSLGFVVLARFGRGAFVERGSELEGVWTGTGPPM
jgi:hypothetical protein